MPIKLIMVYAVIAATIALLTGPIPGTSAILTLLELGMSYHIAKRYSISLQLSEIGVVASILYVLIELLKLGISTVLEFFPFMGWYVVKPALAFGFVIGLGLVLSLYFRDQQRSRQASQST